MQPQQFSPTSPFAFWDGAFTPAELDQIEALGEARAQGKATLLESTVNDDVLHRVPPITRGIRKALVAWTAGPNSDESFPMGIDAHQLPAGFLAAWLTLQLSEPSAYEGVDLLLQGGSGGPVRAHKARGSLVAFPSYMLHRVTPVTAGTRKSMVVWVAGPPFR